MAQIPLYLKMTAEMPRPTEPEFYWLTQNGIFMCRNHPFFSSDVPARRPPKALAPHRPECVIRYPKVPASMLEFIVGFFSRVYDLHRSESVVLLLWDMDRRRYRLLVPEQEATVWHSWYGYRSPMDVHYTVPAPLPPRHLLVGDIHCHGDMAAYSSWTDQEDEVYRDGVHAIVGRIENEPPSFHLEMSIDGHRFSLEMEQIFEEYRKRRRIVPQKWLDKVKIKVDGATRSSWSSSDLTTTDSSWTSRRKKDPWDFE